MATTTSERFVKKARAEYDGYLLVEDDYVKESFRIMFENTRDISNEIDALTATVSDLTSRLTAAETRLANAQTSFSRFKHEIQGATNPLCNHRWDGKSFKPADAIA